MPRPPKPAAERQRTNSPSVGLVLIEDKRVVAPSAPKGLLKSTTDAWTVFWRSQMAQLVQVDTDLPALTRLFALYDEHERCYRASREDRLVIGSQGQYVLNPLYRQMVTLETEIRNLEDRFGLSPMARLKLGITFGEAHRSLDSLNRAALEDIDDDHEPQADDDPRIKIVSPAV